MEYWAGADIFRTHIKNYRNLGIIIIGIIGILLLSGNEQETGLLPRFQFLEIDCKKSCKNSTMTPLRLL